MSQISILGFTASPSTSSATSIHWSILLSPTTDSLPERPKSKSAAARFFRTRSSSKSGPELPSTALFDMHNHQLRQQPFPAPVKSDSFAATDSNASSTRTAATTNIESSDPDKLLSLVLKIKLATHHCPPSKLASKVSSLLYRTPTYGPEDDWLRAALHMLVGSDVLESMPSNATSFDADGILDFAGEAIKEYLQSRSAQNGQGTEEAKTELETLELDYAAHLAQNAQVKAMLAHHTITPSQSMVQPRLQASTYQTTATSRPKNQTARSSVSSKHSATDALSVGYKFLGLRISPSPHARHYYTANNGRRVYSFERRDDPYGGLM